MMPYPFDCPLCTQRYWREESVMYDEGYDDSVCHHCYDKLQAERRDIAFAEKGDQTMTEFNLAYFLFFLFASVIIIAWLTIDDDDFNKKYDRYRKSRFEDEEI